MQHWKESGFSGSFFSFKCRSLRIGSYQFTSVDRVLFSPEGLVIRAPVLNSQETSKLEWISLNLPMHLLLQVETHFDQDLLVIFLLCAPSLCRKVSAELRLKENGQFWDPLSMEKSQRLLTLLPCCLDDSVKKAIKETFSCASSNMLHEITTFEAHKTLLLSSPSQGQFQCCLNSKLVCEFFLFLLQCDKIEVSLAEGNLFYTENAEILSQSSSRPVVCFLFSLCSDHFPKFFSFVFY